ncbi:MAG: hypothetical protein NVSMB60_32630 [Mycobacterium sp.]
MSLPLTSINAQHKLSLWTLVWRRVVVFAKVRVDGPTVGQVASTKVYESDPVVRSGVS